MHIALGKDAKVSMALTYTYKRNTKDEKSRGSGKMSFDTVSFLIQKRMTY
jgi:hypothetical protein